MIEQQKVTRKLSAILSADVKEYSRLMSDDESHTIKTLKEYREIMSGIIEQKSGRVVDALGDNLMAEFPSIVNAVLSAVEIQRVLKQKNTSVPDDKKLEFRIGVNIGDVVEDGESLYGEGVNIAARIEGLAEPGGVCISRGAYDHIKNKLNFGYEFIGEHSVRNIKDPVRVYKVLLESKDAGKIIGDMPKPLLKPGTWATVIVATIILVLIGYQAFKKITTPEFEPAVVENMAFPLPEKPSIAVMPFDNMSDDKGQEYFSDGIAEDIITILSKSDQLFVIARNSTFVYKGKPVNIKQVAEKLGVRYVLEGSVRKSEDKVRITAQLIDAVDGNHLWAERYERELKDLFELQDEITLKIVTSLHVKLTEGEQARMWARNVKNLDLTLKGIEAVSLLFKGTGESIVRFGQLAEEMVDMYPENSSGYELLAWYNYYLAMIGKSPKESIGKAFKYAQKVFSFDELNPNVYNLFCAIYPYLRQHEKAIAAGKKAVTLNPNGADAHQWLGVALNFAGKPDEAIPHFKQAIRLDPFPNNYYFTNLGISYRIKGKYTEALAEFKKSFKLNSEYLHNLLSLASIYALLDRQEEANAIAEKVIEKFPDFSVAPVSKAWPYKNPKDLNLIIDAMRKAGLPENPPLPLPDKPSIAVMPFDNMSGDPEQEYFCDGISEDIITTLSKTDELFVIARNSTFTYKDKPVKVQQIARELGVRYVLEGSVRRAEDRVRITAQLIDAVAGKHLWAERYDRDIKDIFLLQDEITMNIVNALQLKLTEGEQIRMSKKRYKTLDVKFKAMEAYSLWKKGTVESFMRYAQISQELIDMAPESEIGYTDLAWYYWALAIQGISPQESIEKAFELVQKALSLDEYCPHVYTLLSNLYTLLGQYEKAIAAGEKGVALYPNGTENHCGLGITLMFADKLDDAIGHFNQAIRLDPFPQYYYYAHLSRCYVLKGEYEKALSEVKKAIHVSPDALLNHISLAIIYSLLNRQEEASVAAKKVLESDPEFSVIRNSKAQPYKNKAYFKLEVDALLKAGLPE